MVKKALCAVFILFFSISALYAANKKNITLNMQGTGRQDLVEGFIFALKIEANAAGYDVSDNPTAAKYFIKFSVEFDNVEQKSRFNVSLVKAEGMVEVIAMEYLFTDEEEMLLYSQLVFFMLMANLPEDEIAPPAPVTVLVSEDDSWRNKWLYFRASFDYTFMYLAIKPDDISKVAGIYNDAVDPWLMAPLDNKIVPVPGVRLGAEVQLLDFLSLEPGVQISLEEVVKKHMMYNILFTMELKFPLKFFSGMVLEPYLAVGYPMRFPKANEVFDSLPMLSYGAGLQTAVKMGKNGALVLDVAYLLYMGDTGLKNYYEPLYPKPEVIKYDYSVLTFGIGYKHGFFDRKKK
jgi:hypothetical protein